MNETEKTECVVFLEKVLKGANISLYNAKHRNTNPDEIKNIERKIRVYNNLLTMVKGGDT